AFLASIWRTEHFTRLVIAGQVLAGHVAGKHDIFRRPALTPGEAAIALEWPTAPDDDQTCIGLAFEDHRPGAQQELEPFAFFKTAHEQYGWSPVAQLRQGRVAFEKTREIDAIGDHPVIRREVFADEFAGRTGDSDVAV